MKFIYYNCFNTFKIILYALCGIFIYCTVIFTYYARVSFTLCMTLDEALRWVDRLGFYFFGLVFVCDVAGGTTDKRQHDQ